MITSKAKLAEYCLRCLGSPVIQINIDESQVNDRVNDALQMYQDFHGSGSERRFTARVITEKDMERGFLTLDDSIIAVIRVFALNRAYDTSNLQYHAFMTDIMEQMKAPSAQMHGYVIAQQHLALIDTFMNYEKQFRFNENTNRLFIDTDWSLFKVGQILMVEAYHPVDSSEFIDVLNDDWLKGYATALLKKQWGMNLLKYNGFQLPSGVVINGEAILAEAKEEIQAHMEELERKHQFPPDFFVG